MKTSEAQELIRGMVKEEKVTYDPKRGLVLTEKIAGIGLAFLCELSTEQVSRIGQEFDPLFPTRKRLASLHRSGVSADALRAMIDELEGKTPTPKLPDTEPTPGTEGEPDTVDDDTPLEAYGGLSRNAYMEAIEKGERKVDFPPNGWEEVEREQLEKDAQNAEDNQGQLPLSGETTDPGTGGGVPTERPTAEGIGQESGTNGASDNIQQPGPGTVGRRPRGRSGITGEGGTL